MKKILITGKNSFIGESFETFLKSFENDYEIYTLDMIDKNWINFDFKNYDVVFHVAGIAHSDISNVSDERKQLYYDVNTNLAIKVANKAKTSGVKQFIFMSSMIIFSGCKEDCINDKTIPTPLNFYGDSKLQADIKIRELESPTFKVVVLRPPMIYGKGCKGNYPLLKKIALKTSIFPKYKNKRSMLYVNNLCSFLKLIVDNEDRGIFYPQNDEYTNTSTMVKNIAECNGHKVILIPGFGWLISLMKHFPGKIGKLTTKAFGSSYYEKSLSEYSTKYCLYDLEKSIEEVEK